MAVQPFTFFVNGASHRCEVDSDKPLLWVLREDLGLTGTKYGCGIAMCGACTVLIQDDRPKVEQPPPMIPVRSCVLRAEAAKERRITTIEGLSHDNDHPVQRAWIEQDVPQCGYCQSGQILATVALLEGWPKDGSALGDDDINASLAGNLCRCGTYPRIRKAVKAAAAKLGLATK